MSTILNWLLLASFVSLVVGLIKPNLLKKLFGETMGRKKIALVFSLSTLVLLVAAAMTDPSSAPKSTPTTIATHTKSEEPAKVAPTQPKTDEQILENQITQAIGSAGNLTSKISYRGVEIQKSDPGRPKDTKMITVKIDITDFYNKSALLKDTGKVSSQIFRAIYTSNIPAYDAFVWYYGETTDRYGNKKDDVILAYSIDKPTLEKINWQNFDTSKLCTFLQQEEQLAADASANVACHTLVNIQ